MTKSSISTELVVLADYALTSEEKKLSVMGIFDKVFVQKIPSSHARLSFVVTFVGKADTTQKVLLQVLKPSGQESFHTDVTLTFGSNGKFNFVSNFEGFPIEEAGQYVFRFMDGKKEIATTTLDAIVVRTDTKTKN